MFTRFIRGGTFAGNITMLAGATALGQGIVTLGYPILARLFTPADFGLLSIYGATISILVVGASGRYEMAIPLPESMEDGMHLLVLSLLCAALTTVILALGLVLFKGPFLARSGAAALRPYLWMIPVGFFGAAGYRALTLWAVRVRAYPVIGKTKVTQAVFQALTQIGAGGLNVGVAGLLAGDILGRAGGLGTLGRLAWKSFDAKKISWNTLWRLACRYRRFPLFSAWSAVLNGFGLQVPTLLLGAAYGMEVAGWFGLGMRMVGIPANLIGQSVANVYQAEASRMSYEDLPGLKRLYFNTAGWLALVSVPPFLLLAAIAPWVFSTLFGPGWEKSGYFLRLMSIPCCLEFIFWPLSHTLNILEQQSWQLAWDCARLVLTCGGVLIVRRLGGGPSQAILAYGAVMMLAHSAMFILGWLAIRRALLSRLAGSAWSKRETS